MSEDGASAATCRHRHRQHGRSTCQMVQVLERRVVLLYLKTPHLLLSQSAVCQALLPDIPFQALELSSKSFTSETHGRNKITQTLHAPQNVMMSSCVLPG